MIRRALVVLVLAGAGWLASAGPAVAANPLGCQSRIQYGVPPSGQLPTGKHHACSSGSKLAGAIIGGVAVLVGAGLRAWDAVAAVVRDIEAAKRSLPRGGRHRPGKGVDPQPPTHPSRSGPVGQDLPWRGRAGGRSGGGAHNPDNLSRSHVPRHAPDRDPKSQIGREIDRIAAKNPKPPLPSPKLLDGIENILRGGG